MAKKILALCLSLALTLCGCAQKDVTSEAIQSETIDAVEKNTDIQDNVLDDAVEETVPEFNSLDDPELLQYIEDTVYTGLVDEFDSEDYIIENVNTVYVSTEYLEEISYNSQSNIWFGYTLDEVEDMFEKDTAYVFTLSDNGETEVVPFEPYDDTYDKVIKNVAIGTGVILICVTVSVASGGMGAAPVSMIFAASAKTGTTMALSMGTMNAVISGVITGYETNDFEEVKKAALLSFSEGYKWGAITGCITGGLNEANAIRNASTAVDQLENVPQWRQAELRALQKYGGNEQVSYLAGQEVEFGTAGATRPDVVRMVDGHLEAIEVKYYNLESSASMNTLFRELDREIPARIANMPEGTTQRLVLDVTGRTFSQETVVSARAQIVEHFMDIYPNLPIDIVGL